MSAEHIVEVTYSGGRVRRVHSSDEQRAKARAERFRRNPRVEKVSARLASEVDS